MNTQGSSSLIIPQRGVVDRLQKGVMVFLFTLLFVFLGFYGFIHLNLEKQQEQRDKLTSFASVVNDTEKHLMEWLLVDDQQLYTNQIAVPSTEYFYKTLIQKLHFIDQGLQDIEGVIGHDSSPYLNLLGQVEGREVNAFVLSEADSQSMYVVLQSLKILGEELSESQIDLHGIQQAFVEQTILIGVAVFFFLVLVVVTMSIRFGRQVHSGFSNVQHILQCRDQAGVVDLPKRNFVDEFTVLGAVINEDLSSKEQVIREKSDLLSNVSSALLCVDDPFLIADSEGKVELFSQGAEALWTSNLDAFESVFDTDGEETGLIGKHVADNILLSDEQVSLKLSDSMYALRVKQIVSGGSDSNADSTESESSLGFVISIVLKSELAELRVLQSSLKLMEQDVWNIPVRILRQDSPYASFAQSLELVRHQVAALLDNISTSSDQTEDSGKITKLQQIASLVDEKSHSNTVVSGTDIIVADFSSATNIQEELSDMAWLSEQLRDSLILGYELVLQRLALVEKDLSSDVFLLSDVERCLTDVRAGVLSSLSASEGEGENIRRRFAVDLDHDISKVQSQVEDMKSMAASTLSLLESDRSVGVTRLDRARESIDNIVEKVHRLMLNTSDVEDNEDSRKLIGEPEGDPSSF